MVSKTIGERMAKLETDVGYLGESHNELKHMMKDFIDKAIELLSKFSELQDLTARKFPVNHDLHQAYIGGDDESVKKLFEQRENFMRQFYIVGIQPHFKSYLTRLK